MYSILEFNHLQHSNIIGHNTNLHAEFFSSLAELWLWQYQLQGYRGLFHFGGPWLRISHASAKRVSDSLHTYFLSSSPPFSSYYK